MIRDQRLLQQLMELNTLEQVFKQVYLLRRQYGQVEKLNHILVRMGIQAEQYWMPGVNMDQDIYLTQNLSYDVVGLEKAPVNFGLHPRYQSYSLHRHTFFECMIVLRGACQNIVEGSSMDLREGEICMIPPYVRHMVGVYDDESIVANLLFTREHLTGRLLQVAHPAVVAQPLPKLQQLLLISCGQGLHRRAALHEPVEVGQHRRHPGLLEHDLRHPDAVRVADAAPRQDALVDIVPRQQRRGEGVESFLFVHASPIGQKRAAKPQRRQSSSLGQRREKPSRSAHARSLCRISESGCVNKFPSAMSPS